MEQSKTVRVEFVEQSKAVTAHVKIEYTGDLSLDSDMVLQEAQRIYDDAQRYSTLKTLEKSR